MTDGTPPAEQPIQVDTSVTSTAIVVAFRQAMLVIAGFGMMIGFIKTHNLVGLVNYIKGNDFVTFVTTATALGVFLYGQWRARADRRNSVAMAKAVSDAVAVLAPSWITRLLNAVRGGISTAPKQG